MRCIGSGGGDVGVILVSGSFGSQPIFKLTFSPRIVILISSRVT